MALQIGVSFLISALMNFVAVFFNTAVASSLFSTESTGDVSRLLGYFLLIFIGFTYLAIAIEGFTVEQ